MTTDDLPIIGASSHIPNLWFATGHGMPGMSMSNATAELLTAQMLGRETVIDPIPYAPRRFGLWSPEPICHSQNNHRLAGRPMNPATAPLRLLTALLLMSNIGESAAQCVNARAASMNGIRREHSAVRLQDGRVLVAGGIETVETGTWPLSRTEVFDPTTGAWTEAGELLVAREYGVLVALEDGGAMYIGGQALMIGMSDAVDIFDPVTLQWHAGSPLEQGRRLHTATVLPGDKVVVTGGETGNGYSVQTEVFNPQSGAWDSAEDLAQSRSTHTAEVLPNGKVIVMGGRTSGDVLLKSTELFDPASGDWTNGPDMNGSRRLHTSNLVPEGLFVIGGLGTQQPERLGSVSDPWQNVAPSPVPRSIHQGSTTHDGTIVITGNQSDTNVVSMFDPTTNAWHDLPRLLKARAGHTSTTLDDGRILIAGGWRFGEWGFTDVEIINPWSLFCSEFE